MLKDTARFGVDVVCAGGVVVALILWSWWQTLKVRFLRSVGRQAHADRVEAAADQAMNAFAGLS